MTVKLLDIPLLLIEKGIVKNAHSANSTLIYAIEWMSGSTFDFEKSAVKVHRARLRKLGLDIAKPFAGEIIFPAAI